MGKHYSLVKAYCKLTIIPLEFRLTLFSPHLIFQSEAYQYKTVRGALRSIYTTEGTKGKQYYGNICWLNLFCRWLVHVFVISKSLTVLIYDPPKTLSWVSSSTFKLLYDCVKHSAVFIVVVKVVALLLPFINPWAFFLHRFIQWNGSHFIARCTLLRNLSTVLHTDQESNTPRWVFFCPSHSVTEWHSVVGLSCCRESKFSCGSPSK